MAHAFPILSCENGSLATRSKCSCGIFPCHLSVTFVLLGEVVWCSVQHRERVGLLCATALRCPCLCVIVDQHRVGKTPSAQRLSWPGLHDRCTTLWLLALRLQGLMMGYLWTSYHEVLLLGTRARPSPVSSATHVLFLAGISRCFSVMQITDIADWMLLWCLALDRAGDGLYTDIAKLEGRGSAEQFHRLHVFGDISTKDRECPSSASAADKGTY